MDSVIRSLYQEQASNPATLGVLLIEGCEKNFFSPDFFDTLLFVITNTGKKDLDIKYYSYNEKILALYLIDEKQLNEWLISGTNKKIFYWILNGKPLFDRNDFLNRLLRELKDFPFHERKLKIGLEFAKLIREYTEGRRFYESKQYFDAYIHTLHSLHYLARLALIEKGYHPEVSLWKQVKTVEPEIYKMYDELINSKESLEKRIELLFLASEFFIHKRTEIGTTHLLEILREKPYWSLQDVMEHPELKLYASDLAILLEYLVEKGYLNICLEQSKRKHLFHRYYTVKNNM